MIMRLPSLSGILTGLLLICASPSFAANSAMDKKLSDSLTAISRQMFAEHNEYFILAEALKDGYLEDGKNYSVEYSRSGISVNGRRLPEASESRYREMIRDFYANGSAQTGPDSWIMESDSLSLAGDILDPHSKLRTRGPWHHTDRKPGRVLIIEEMARDGLVDTTRPVHISYTLQAITVNGQMLQPGHSDKYKMLFRILEEFVPRKETDVYSIRK